MTSTLGATAPADFLAGLLALADGTGVDGHVWVVVDGRPVAAGGELSRLDADRLARLERGSASGLRVAFRTAIGG